MSRDYKEIDKVIGRSKSNLIGAYDKGYNAGFRDGLLKGKDEQEKNMFEKGMREAWAVVTEIADMSRGMQYEVFNEYPLHTILKHNTPYGAIKKIKEYEEKINRTESGEEDNVLKVDDEILLEDGISKAIVVHINEDSTFECMVDSGNIVSLSHDDNWTKTGKSYNVFKSLTKALRNEAS